MRVHDAEVSCAHLVSCKNVPWPVGCFFFCAPVLPNSIRIQEPHFCAGRDARAWCQTQQLEHIWQHVRPRKCAPGAPTHWVLYKSQCAPKCAPGTSLPEEKMTVETQNPSGPQTAMRVVHSPRPRIPETHVTALFLSTPLDTARVMQP